MKLIVTSPIVLVLDPPRDRAPLDRTVVACVETRATVAKDLAVLTGKRAHRATLVRPRPRPVRRAQSVKPNEIA